MSASEPPIYPYWVIPAKFLAGEYPGQKPYLVPTTEQKISYLLSLGANVFIDLTEPGKLVPYDAILHEQGDLMDQAVEYHRYAIDDFGVPSPGQMTAILDAIDAALATGHVVYLHCLGGIGRTGTVVGCYLVRHGLSGKQALEKIKQLRQDLPDHWMRSPESDAQWRMVLEWQTIR
jgi:protein-tyrosine phosphatase